MKLLFGCFVLIMLSALDAFPQSSKVKFISDTLVIQADGPMKRIQILPR